MYYIGTSYFLNNYSKYCSKISFWTYFFFETKKPFSFPNRLYRIIYSRILLSTKLGPIRPMTVIYYVAARLYCNICITVYSGFKVIIIKLRLCPLNHSDCLWPLWHSFIHNCKSYANVPYSILYYYCYSEERKKTTQVPFDVDVSQWLFIYNKSQNFSIHLNHYTSVENAKFYLER